MKRGNRQSLGIDRIRGEGFLTSEVLSLRVVGMVENGRKRMGSSSSYFSASFPYQAGDRHHHGGENFRA